MEEEAFSTHRVPPMDRERDGRRPGRRRVRLWITAARRFWTREDDVLSTSRSCRCGRLTIGAKSGVMRDIHNGATVVGSPASPDNAGQAPVGSPRPSCPRWCGACATSKNRSRLLRIAPHEPVS